MQRLVKVSQSLEGLPSDASYSTHNTVIVVVPRATDPFARPLFCIQSSAWAGEI